MRTINACLVILLLSINLTKSFDFASLKEIQSLKQNSFASSLIETISLSLSSSKSEDATEVLKMLGDLKSQLQTDQENDTKTYTAKNDEFEAHIKKLSEEITSLGEAIAALAARIAELSNLISKAAENIKSFGNRITNLERTSSELKDTFEKDSKYYTEKIQGLRSLLVRMVEVVNKLRQMEGSVSGQKIFNHINATETERRDIAWKAAQKSFLQIKKQIPVEFSNLVELTLNADQGALKKLIEILEKINADIKGEISNKEKYLENMTNSHTELQKQMADEIQSNKDAKKKQEDNKQLYENEKGEKETEKANKETRKAALENEKNINLGLQTQLKTTHDKERQDRSKEVEIVNVLINIVEKRLVKRN